MGVQEYSGGVQAREETIVKYLPLVNRIANRLAMGLPDHVDKNDLVSSGIIGLMDALEKYNPSKGMIHKYLPMRIKGAMLDELRKMSWLPRGLLAKTREVDKAYAVLCGELKRAPTDEELAEYLQISPREMSMLLTHVNSRSLVHLEEFLFTDEGNSPTVEECIRDKNEWANPEENLLKKERLALLEKAIATLPEREQLILQLYYRDELTLKEIGQVLDISESRVSQIHSRIMLKLRHQLKGE